MRFEFAPPDSSLHPIYSQVPDLQVLDLLGHPDHLPYNSIGHVGDFDYLEELEGWKAIAIHGGAGRLPTDAAAEQNINQQMTMLRIIINRGWNRLTADGMSALDVATETVNDLERALPFNAGDGASLNAEGETELEGGLMDGATHLFAGLTGLTVTPDTIKVVRNVLDNISEEDIYGEDIYGGRGADKIAEKISKKSGVLLRPPLITDYRRARLQSALEAKLKAQQERRARLRQAGDTVGVIVFDGKSFAAGSSTGGTAGKGVGRVGDTIYPGAGIFATDIGAACATGNGEAIRFNMASLTAFTLADEYSSPEREYFTPERSVKRATHKVIHQLELSKAPGGLLLLFGRRGAMHFGAANTTDTLMPHAFMMSGQLEPTVRRSAHILEA